MSVLHLSQQGDGSQRCLPSNNTPPVEPTAEQRIPEQRQQPVYQQGNDEQSVGPSLPDTEQTRSGQEQHPTHQQGYDDQVNGLTSSEVSCPIQETDEIVGHGLNACEQQTVNQQSDSGRSNDLSHFLLNGEEVVSIEESSIQESSACQLVNGQQQQPRYQQNTQSRALSYPTQEMGLDTSQGRDTQQLCNPIQETAPFVEHEPDEDLSPCHQQLNSADTNGVSSTSDREHAVEHSCSPPELQLWRQESDRQADITSTRFLSEIKYIVIFLYPT